MKKNCKIAKFLRDFMRSRRDPRTYADLHIDDECSPHGQTTNKIVQGVGRKDQVSQRTMCAPNLVAMVPVEKLFQSEKNAESGSNPDISGDAGFHGSDRRWNQVKQGATQQRPCGQSDQWQEKVPELRFRA